MNGAENLLDTLLASGVEVCFANPGTSEMQLVSAIGNSGRMRAILCLFEGVASGAADGYARMTGRPAATLLHLGPGFANSMANQHNAMRARVPLVNLVGDHATRHQHCDAPLTSDVAAHARISSAWVRTATSPDDLARAGAEAVQAARRGAGRIATLIVPADHAWSEAGTLAPALPVEPRDRVAPVAVTRAAEALGSATAPVLYLGGQALCEPALGIAGRIARRTGARLICPTFPTRLQRGAGRPPVERLPYFAEDALESLSGVDRMVLAGARAPVSFFAYPGKPSSLVPEGCDVHRLATADHDLEHALSALAEALDAVDPGDPTPDTRPPAPGDGPLSPLAVGQSVAAALPRDAIVVDEGATCGMAIFPATVQAAAHDWLTLTGGSIGIGLPLALGAAVACPDRKVVALQADGSAMYTVQALWTMARERTDVVVVLLNNRSYAILNIELARVGASQPTPKTLSLLDLSDPDIDWIGIARGMGVNASRATTAAEFHEQFDAAMRRPGPHLIDAVVEQVLAG